MKTTYTYTYILYEINYLLVIYLYDNVQPHNLHVKNKLIPIYDK